MLPALEEAFRYWSSSHTGLLNDFLEEIRGDTSTIEYHNVPALNPCALGDWRRTGQMATVRPLIARCSLEMVRERQCLWLASCLILTEQREEGEEEALHSHSFPQLQVLAPPYWPSQAPGV